MSDDNVIEGNFGQPTETIEPPTEAIEGVQELFEDEVPEYHTILEVWREVLKPSLTEVDKKVTPQWANRMVQSYAQLTFNDCNKLHVRYFEHIQDLLKIVEAEIATDAKCLEPKSPEDDAVLNSQHYKNVLRDWQLAFLQWELDWSCLDEDAAVQIAALSETHKAFFGPTGITAFLDNIGFEYTDDDQAELAVALEELKEGQ